MLLPPVILSVAKDLYITAMTVNGLDPVILSVAKDLYIT